MTILRAEGIRKSYGGRLALAADSLAFEPGEIVALSGPNGAGKSTLLRILALLEYPDAGRIFFRDRTLSRHGEWFAARRAITLVDQKPYAFPGTVEHNVGYGLRLRGAAADEAATRTAEALTAVGLFDLRRRPARGLSGGELQRMALARALVCSPEVLLLDEPTAHVDPQRGREVEALILDLARRRRVAIVLATHAGDQAERLADRILLLDDGRLIDEQNRAADGRMLRDQRGLVLVLPATAPGTARIEAVELVPAGARVRLDAPRLSVRIPEPDLQSARPIPGELVSIVGGSDGAPSPVSAT